MNEIMLAVLLTATLLVGCLVPTQPMPVPTVSVFLPTPTATATNVLPTTPTPNSAATVTAKPTATIPPDGAASLDQPFTLSIGQTVTFERTTSFTFVNVTGDSRCPTGVQCVWAGIVSTKIQMTQGGAQASVTITADKDPASLSLNGMTYQVTLTNVTPYPVRPGPIAPEDYRATFTVSES